MSAVIQILLNQPRRELLKPGWAKSRTAWAMLPATFSTPDGKYVEGQLPKELWREPNKGVIMLKPSPLKAEYWEDTTWSTFRLGLSSFNFSGTQVLELASNGSLLLKRASPTSPIVEYTADIATAALLLLMQTDMINFMTTKTALAVNEGWATWVHPPGIYTDRATDYLVVKWAERYALHFRMNGTASVWVNQGTPPVPVWVEKTTFSISGGSIDHTRPFQVTVIPWGRQYITFVFSQTKLGGPTLLSSTIVHAESTYLYDIGKYEGPTTYDSISQQYVKTKQGNLSVCGRRYLYQYGFAFSRIRYSSSGTLNVFPEKLPEVLDQTGQDPSVTGRGYFGQISGASATNLTVSFVNEDNTAWDKTTDKNLVTRFVLAATTDKLYTPELWSEDIEITEATHTPGWTPVDVSDRWNYVRFQITTEPDVALAEFKLEDTPSYASLLHGWGPVRIKVDGYNVYDGYIYSRHPTLERMIDNSGTAGAPKTKAIMLTQVSCRNLWVRLNECLVSDWTFLDKSGILTTIKKLIKHAGFTDADIVVTDPDGYLAALEFEGFVDPNDQKTFNQDGNVGDALREIIKWFGIRPIRVRPINGQWHVYLAPQYTGTNPTVSFMLKNLDYSQSMATRWAANNYGIISNPEWAIEEPEFNGLICRSSDGTGDDGRAVQSVIPAILADPLSLSDPSYFRFMGRAKYKIVAPPEITLAQTQAELDKLARVYWDRNANHKGILEFRGEWSKDIDVDMFIWVKGVNDIGNKVSYGAYRIDSINVETQTDIASASYDTRWKHEADYTCVYVGSASDGTYPMFTTELPPE